MSIVNGVWHDAKIDLPPGHQDVLVVKQLKSGQRSIAIAYCIPNYERTDWKTGEKTIEPYWVCGGNNNVIYWMPLPKIPEN